MSIILCKCCNTGLVDQQIADVAEEILRQSGEGVFYVDDLCALAAKQDDLFKQWARAENLTVLACFPRAIQALFAQAQVQLPPHTKFINLRTIESPAQAKEALANIVKSEQGADLGKCTSVAATDPQWQPWYPTIDYDRCKNCKQCLNFCLFGVYALREGQVQVTQPDKCKTGCPACARVCPYAAIIFPKYDKSPINGDQVDESRWKQDHAASSESLKDRLGGNIYQILKNRGKSDTNPRSLEDLKELKDQFDIPDQVFNAENDSL